MGTIDQEAIDQALAIIDEGLATMLHRELVSTAEATDVLLDVRSMLAGLGVLEPEPAVAN
jgi:hypothetical protein